MCIDKNQIFHKFSDGVEFKPDIGRIKQLGEVFTPYPIVIKMIKDIGLAKDKSNATVLEPASGHGNFGVEILNFKIQQVLKEMKQDNVSEKDWTKEYEIRSLLALASLYQNDINGQNINELINRLAPFILSMYKKYAKNKKNEISQHYHIAMTNILSANCIKADFTTSQKWRIKFIFYFRNGDYIYRVRKSLYDLEQTKILDKNEGYKISMFQDEPSLTINDADIIKYDKWHEKINTKNFWELTEELKMSKDKIMREREREDYNDNDVYERIQQDLRRKFDISDKDFKFSYCISNPPYQIQVGKRNHNIYDKFWFLVTKLCKKVSMIFPKGWQTSTGRASGSTKHYLIREDKHIISVDNYYEDIHKNPLILFTTASTGGVNIVNWDQDYDNKGSVDFYEYGIFKSKKRFKKYTWIRTKS